MASNEERSTLSERRQRRRARRQEMLQQSNETTASEGAAIQTSVKPRGKDAPTPSAPRRAVADEGGFLSNNIITRPLVRFWGYLQDVGTEIRKVVWPSRADARRLTGIVLLVTIIAAISLGIISFGLSELFRLGIETPLILLGSFALIVVGTFIRLRRTARSGSY